MPKSAHVRLIILDSHGRRIETLLDEELNSGNHMVEFDAERLPSGIYLYQIQAGHFSRTRRMLLIR